MMSSKLWNSEYCKNHDRNYVVKWDRDAAKREIRRIEKRNAASRTLIGKIRWILNIEKY